MTYLLWGLLVALSLKILLVLYRVLKGPTIFDRMVGLGVIGTDVILLILFIGFLADEIDMFVDMSIAYGALGFMGYLIVAKYFERKGDLEG
ncbi:MAG TPA: pH regulation protein F [Peptococcaceae bacterium]|nr:pH regulation protein F [Peptococcaceae bacterium]